ncbi:secoisolariciresinol dehydrogenase-like isoform X1 [Musa acuminata AAA Group]|uniref:secoisolariciresinol dehydrogenase-like isoform X1 n=2 Tax=Musa acuminata AAA Group TaxID=214697 RepID=UPI0031D9682E
MMCSLVMVFRCKRIWAMRGSVSYLQQQHYFSTQPARLAGKVAVITGAASGIGKATAAEFIRHGAKVILADVHHELGKATADELGPAATFVGCDVTQEPHVAAAVDLAVAKHGHLDIMFNNAGVAGSLAMSITDLDLADFDRTMAINARSVVAGIKHAARVMVPRRAGCILCTASIAGMLGGITPHDYSVSKAAVLGAARSAAAELSKHGVRVNCISPHALPTPFRINAIKKMMPEVDVRRVKEMIEATGELEGTKCEVADAVNAAVYLASDEAKYISGHNLVVDGGFTACKYLRLPLP